MDQSYSMRNSSVISSPILLTAAYDGRIIAWNTTLPIWKPEKEVPAQKDVSVNRVAISDDGRLVGVATSNGIKIYDFPTFEILINQDEKSNATSIGFQTMGEFVYYSLESGLLCLYDLHSKSKSVIHTELTDINCAELAPNQVDIFFADSSGNVKSFDVSSKKIKLSQFGTKNVPIRAIAVSAAGNILAVGDSVGDLFWWLLLEDDVP
jgi:WD40 repeat protein